MKVQDEKEERERECKRVGGGGIVPLMGGRCILYTYTQVSTGSLRIFYILNTRLHCIFKEKILGNGDFF